MRINTINTWALVVFITGVFSSCMKEGTNIFNMFDVEVTYHNKLPNAITDYKQVNDGDSILLDFTITSPTKDMFMVCAFEVGTSGPFKKISLNKDQRRSYSGVIRLKANARAGKTSYRIWALDTAGVYLGDGYKTVTIEVAPNFAYYINRYLYIPDSTTKANECYLALHSGETFNYLTGGSNAGKIDLGLYSTVTPPPTLARSFYIYSLAAPTLPFTIYDISGWSKRTTLFATPRTGQATAFQAIGTASALETLAKAATPNQTTPPAALLTGSVVYFLTPENKYGALLVNSIGADFKGVFLNMSIKVQQ